MVLNTYFNTLREIQVSFEIAHKNDFLALPCQLIMSRSLVKTLALNASIDVHSFKDS